MKQTGLAMAIRVHPDSCLGVASQPSSRRPAWQRQVASSDSPPGRKQRFLGQTSTLALAV